MRYQPIQNAMWALIISMALCFFIMGCHGREAMPTGPHPGPGRYTSALTVDGFKRDYIVHVPSGYDSGEKTPVVIMLHGGGGKAKAAIRETGWTEKADKAGFLAVFPNALARDPLRHSSFARNPQLWNDGSDRFRPDHEEVDDIRFISALLDDLSTRFNVDRRRVFVTGFSNGASMSFLIGARLSNRIAAIAPVAGACWIDPVQLSRPVPMLYITGRADPLNPIDGGVPRLATGAGVTVRAKPKPPVRESILKWVKAIGCETEPRKVCEANGVRVETFGPSGNDGEVVYITVDGLGHTWAGGRSILPEILVGEASDRINATDVIWDFFRKHPILS